MSIVLPKHADELAELKDKMEQGLQTLSLHTNYFHRIGKKLDIGSEPTSGAGPQPRPN